MDNLTEMQRTLISLQNVSPRDRRSLIKELESQGKQVLLKNGIYTIIDEQNQSHRLERRKCPHCREEKLLSDFMGLKNIQVWCKPCRQVDPREAKLAQDREYQRLYPLEKRRAKEKRQEEKHPQWRARTDFHLRKRASSIAVAILQEVAIDAVAMLEEEYEPVQRRKIQQYLQEIIASIERYPSQERTRGKKSEELRAQAQAILKIADGSI